MESGLILYVLYSLVFHWLAYFSSLLVVRKLLKSEWINWYSFLELRGDRIYVGGSPIKRVAWVRFLAVESAVLIGSPTLNDVVQCYWSRHWADNPLSKNEWPLEIANGMQIVAVFPMRIRIKMHDRNVNFLQEPVSFGSISFLEARVSLIFSGSSKNSL